MLRTKNIMPQKINSIVIPTGVSVLSYSAFENCDNLVDVEFPNNDITLYHYAFFGCIKLKNIFIYKNITFNSTRNFYNCVALESVIFNGEVNEIKQETFSYCRSVVLYDFSHCTAIPPLYSVASLGHKNGCVIKIPSALSDTTLGTGNGWESETNWNALTNIVWEVV